MDIPELQIFLSQYKYILLFLGLIFEGPILMVAAGFLLHIGVFNFTPMFIAIFVGDMVGDIIWYCVGYFFAEPFLLKYGYFFGVTPEKLEKAKELFKRYQIKILLISKMTLGLGMALATLVAAGATKTSFRLYMLLNALGEFILISILLLVGYYFGYLYNNITQGFKMIFLFGLIVFISTLIFGFTKYMRTRILSTKL